jgi:signal transduction histidine kinase
MIPNMRNADIPYLADWYAISLRWIIIIGLTISLGLGSNLNVKMVAFLSVPILWNGFVSALAIFNQRLKNHRIVNLSMDTLFAAGLFYLASGMSQGVWWVALLPIFTAAVYYEVRGAAILTPIISLIQAGLSYLISPDLVAPLPLTALIGFNIVSAIAVSAVTLPLINRLRRTYQNQINQRKESERRAQRQERDRMRVLFSMIETFSSTLHYQKVLETALEAGVSAMGASVDGANGMAGAVLLFEDGDLQIKANWHIHSRDLNLSFLAKQGVLNETLQSGEYRMVFMPAEDPELSRMTTLDNQQVALCLPLIRGMNAYGVLFFSHQQAEFFTQERIEILQMISNQAVIAIQNARLYQDLAIEKERIIQSQEEAQKKLARDLHDGPTQSVSAIAMRVSIARKIMERSPEEACEELLRIEELARRTTQEIRHMLFTLRPLVLETEGLVPALQTMSDKLRDVYQQKVIIDADHLVVDRLDPSCQTVIFYLAEEAVNNARKHAEASEIHVRIKYPPNEQAIALLEIVDNGQGFDVQSVLGSYERRGSLGMVNLRERTDLVNGRLHIDSVPGKGTRVRIFIPLTEEAADRLHRGR